MEAFKATNEDDIKVGATTSNENIYVSLLLFKARKILTDQLKFLVVTTDGTTVLYAITIEQSKNSYTL